MVLDPARIGRRFAASQATYNQAAVAQTRMAETLAALLKDNLPPRLERVFEVGCGTGLLTQKLLSGFDIGTLLLNDLYQSDFMMDLASRQPDRVQTLPGNALRLDWPGGLDLWLAGAVVQWFSDPAGVLDRAAASLRPCGWLALSTFLPGTFAEFRQAAGCGLDYADSLVWTSHPELILRAEQQSELVLEFGRPLDVLRHIQATGVGGLGGPDWTRSRLQDFETQYPRLPTGQAPLTYRTVCLLLQKKAA